MSIRIFVLVFGTCFALGASLSTWAADNLQKLHLPTLAPEAKTGPKAKIKVPKGSQIEEYKVNGKVYMVKVIPPKPFPPYLYGCLHVRKMILMSGILRSGCCLISGL